MYFDRIQLVVHVCNILKVIIHKKCKENPPKMYKFQCFWPFFIIFEGLFECNPWILLKYQLTGYNQL